MKRLFIALIASSFLATPMAFAQSHKPHQQTETTIIRKVEKDHHRKKPVVENKRRWSKGHKLSRSERRQIVSEREYRRYRLAKPPRGQQWVRVNNDFLLVGITSGIIASIVAGR